MVAGVGTVGAMVLSRVLSPPALAVGGLWAMAQFSFTADQLDDPRAALLECGIDLSPAAALVTTMGVCLAAAAALVFAFRQRPEWVLRLVGVEAAFVAVWLILDGGGVPGCV
jgi:hypothetical protein